MPEPVVAYGVCLDVVLMVYEDYLDERLEAA